MDDKTRNIQAHMILSRAVMLNAPEYVTVALKKWLHVLEDPKGTADETENVGVGDFANTELVNVRRKNDA